MKHVPCHAKLSSLNQLHVCVAYYARVIHQSDHVGGGGGVT